MYTCGLMTNLSTYRGNLSILKQKLNHTPDVNKKKLQINIVLAVKNHKCK